MDLTNKKSKKRRLIALNVSFWLLLTFLISYGIGQTDEPDRTLVSLFFQGAIGIGLLIVPIVYLNTQVLIPRFFIKKKYWQFGFWVLLIALIWPPLPIYIDNIIDERVFHTKPEDLDDPFTFLGGFVMLFIILLSTLVNMTYRALRQQHKSGEIENERLNTELALLKNQISPHFFFNTLNNLYALALEESKETPKVILKLSEMMRYTIYDCNGTHVPLSSEVTYLENYMSLQQIRHHQQADITFDRRISNEDIQVCPLVFIVFLENAFKHGVDGTESKAFVKMSLEAIPEQIHFKISNSIGTTQQDSGGLGLENVKKRLDLVYGENYDLSTTIEGETFCVDLNIDLK